MQDRPSDTISVAPQRPYRIECECDGGRIVGITILSGSREAVADQFTHRRIAQPAGFVRVLSIREVSDE